VRLEVSESFCLISFVAKKSGEADERNWKSSDGPNSISLCAPHNARSPSYSDGSRITRSCWVSYAFNTTMSSHHNRTLWVAKPRFNWTYRREGRQPEQIQHLLSCCRGSAEDPQRTAFRKHCSQLKETAWFKHYEIRRSQG
jgi:hypothetical protein